LQSGKPIADYWRRKLALRPVDFKQSQMHPKMHPNQVFGDFFKSKSARLKIQEVAAPQEFLLVSAAGLEPATP
jgi:hypothetical protein